MLVYATDPETGETALKPVVRTFRNTTTEWVHITVNDETLTCTPEHPFYSPVKGWTSAVDLRAGDILVMLNGEYVVVEQVQHELLESPETTYNFEIEDYHTYYVGDGPVLVHNKCEADNPLNGIKYTDKVKSQMCIDDNHGFPDIVDNYGQYGKVTQITGRDGLSYTQVQIPGSYHGHDGVFEYIYDVNKKCNHRFFRIQ